MADQLYGEHDIDPVDKDFEHHSLLFTYKCEWCEKNHVKTLELAQKGKDIRDGQFS